MPSLHLYRLFVSHAWTYSTDYERILTFMKSASNFTFSNYSVPKTDPFERTTRAQLEERIRQQIRPVQLVVILAGMYVAHSDWIQFEINFAKSLGKPILGVKPWGAERIPSAVSSAANEMVGWNTPSIVDAARRLVP